MHSGTTWRLGHRPALDGLRGVAILLVLADHFAVPHAAGLGQLGVTVFFVLSGFLITALLLEERADTGRLDLARFYLRRLARLAPALVFCVILVTLFATAVGVSAHGAVPALTYTMNFVQASGTTYQAGLFGHTWSLAIEEQFYLLWPVALLALRRLPVRLPVAIGGAAVLLYVWTLILADHGASAARVGYGPDTRAPALLVGCAIAAYLHSRPARTRRTIPGLGWTPLRALGRYSYGVYLWHYPIVALMVQADPFMPWTTRLWVGLPITAAMVAISWRLVEQPALRLRTLAGQVGSTDLVHHEARGIVAERDGIESPAARDRLIGAELDVVAGG